MACVDIDRGLLEELARDMEDKYRDINFVDEAFDAEESLSSEEDHFYIGREDPIDSWVLECYEPDSNLASDLVESQMKAERKVLLRSLSRKAERGEIPTYRLESINREVISQLLGSVDDRKNVFTPEAGELVEILERETGEDELHVLPEGSGLENVVVAGEPEAGFKRYRNFELTVEAESINRDEDRLMKYLKETDEGFIIYRGSVVATPDIDASSAAVIDVSGLD